MTLTLDLPGDVEERLVEVARKRGLGCEAAAAELLAAAIPTTGHPSGEREAVDEGRLDAAFDTAVQLYEREIRSTAERDHAGGCVAIHPESGDYELGRNSPSARRTLRRRRRDGYIITLEIGEQAPEPALDRLLG